jgi:hypothetical protein
MADLIEGTYATGKGIVRAGSPSDSSDSESSDEEELPIDPALTSTSATTASPVVPTSTTSTTLALTTASQAASTPIVSNKRSRNGHRKAGSQAIDGMMTSIHHLAQSLATDTAVISSPVRKRAAIHAIEDDGDLSDDEHLRVVKHIRHDTGFADTILAICKKSIRTRFIKSELESAEA